MLSLRRTGLKREELLQDLFWEELLEEVLLGTKILLKKVLTHSLPMHICREKIVSPINIHVYFFPQNYKTR